MDKSFVEPDWLDAVRQTQFFYPASGHDLREPLDVFQRNMNVFWFCDVHYQQGLRLSPVICSGGDVSLLQVERSGEVNAKFQECHDHRGKRYMSLEPSRLTEIYQRGDGSRFSVVRRRGYGQIALTKEFANRSIGVFMHRGDSGGEGGSGLCFLGNRKTSYEPCSNLFQKLAEKLMDRALVISDGSNSKIAEIRKFFRTDVLGAYAYQSHQGKTFDFGGFVWTCVGWLSHRYGPTLVWGLQRQWDETEKFGDQ